MRLFLVRLLRGEKAHEHKLSEFVLRFLGSVLNAFGVLEGSLGEGGVVEKKLVFSSLEKTFTRQQKRNSPL